jgi:hypothetical protein
MSSAQAKSTEFFLLGDAPSLVVECGNICVLRNELGVANSLMANVMDKSGLIYKYVQLTVISVR